MQNFARRFTWPARFAQRTFAAGVTAGMLTLQGCANVAWVDDNGRQHVAGWVWMTLPSAKDGYNAAQALRTRSLGVTLTKTELEQAVTLGYSDQTIAFIRDNRIVAADLLKLDNLPEGRSTVEDQKP
jgi:hypothetical protein